MGTPHTPSAWQGSSHAASGLFSIVRYAVLYLSCLALCLRGSCHLVGAVVSFLGVFSRASFFLRWFWFWSCWCSFPSGCWFGVVWWLLFLVFAGFFSFLLWVGGLGGVCLSFSCCCFCSVLFSVGRFCCGGSSWCLFGFWRGLGRFCSCGSLVFLLGACPLFLVRVPLRIVNSAGSHRFFV